MIVVLQKFGLFIYSFYLLFLPDISFISSYFGETIIAFILFLFNIVLLNRKIIHFLKKFKLFPIILVNIILAFYVFVLNINNNFSISNFISNIAFVFQLINFLSLIIWYRKFYRNDASLIDYFIKIGIFQSLLIIMMVVIPPLKNIANFLYSQGTTLEPRFEYVASFRVFGIGSGYTFMLPLTMALIAVLAIYKFFQTNRIKYFVSSIFIVGCSALNGRTGLYIYLIISLFYFIKWLSQKITLQKYFLSFLLIIIFLLTTIFILNSFPKQSEWIFEGVSEIISFISGDGAEGNIGALVGNHLVFPKGLEIIFGTGQIVFGEFGVNFIGVGSDIGYINDLFKGGILYIILLYTTHIRYYSKNIDDKLLTISIILFLLLSNYKGRVMVTSPVLFLSYSIAINNIYLKRSEIKDNVIEKYEVILE